MICDTCGNLSAHRLSIKSDGMSCDKCGNLGSFRFSDVYFNAKVGEHFNPNLADPNKSQWGNVVRSREHKAALMKHLGVREAGDRIHGAR